MLIIWMSSLWVPERASGHRHVEHEPLRRVLKRPVVVALLVVCFLMQMSHGAYYTFYSIYLKGHGYSQLLIGQLWGLGVLAEVGIFLVMHYLVPWLGLARLLLIALSLTVLRWALIGAFVDVIWVVVLAQILHAASFGIYHGSAIQLIHRFFVGRHQGRGQALYSSLSFGAGGAIGSVYSGYAWEGLGANLTFYSSAVMALIAFLVAWRWIRPQIDAQ
jgi:PPP family 3-phenylpropionic acid transporter